MKLCTKHMTEVVEAINRKGMGGMIIQDSAEADLFAQRWLKGTAEAGEIDPLVVSCLEIYQKAFTIVGEYVNKPHFCALCEVERHLKRHEASTEWIDNCTDAVLAIVLANNVPRSRIVIASSIH